MVSLSDNKIAFLFAGQGNQYTGMGKDLYDSFPESKSIFDRADKALGFSISETCFNGSPEVLKQTILSQPAILTVTIAAFEAFISHIPYPIPHIPYMAGLSLGEYSALIAARAFSFEDGLRLVRRRAEIMEEVTHKYPGKMAAVLDLPFDRISDICLKTGAEIANINAPGQVVISGKKETVDKARELCVEAGAKKVIELEVNGAFHSSLMSEASAELKQMMLNTPISTPCVPVVSNYTAIPQYKVVEIEENLLYQIYKPVRWEESIRFILSQGVNNFIEFGPGKVLKGLMRRIEPNAQVINIEKKEDVLNLKS